MSGSVCVCSAARVQRTQPFLRERGRGGRFPVPWDRAHSYLPYGLPPGPCPVWEGGGSEGSSSLSRPGVQNADPYGWEADRACQGAPFPRYASAARPMRPLAAPPNGRCPADTSPVAHRRDQARLGQTCEVHRDQTWDATAFARGGTELTTAAGRSVTPELTVHNQPNPPRTALWCFHRWVHPWGHGVG